VAAVLCIKLLVKSLLYFCKQWFLRKNEFQSVLDQYEGMGLNVKGVDASALLWRLSWSNWSWIEKKSHR
jgi:GMP synthase (glutamine-hydrolysing)